MNTANIGRVPLSPLYAPQYEPQPDAVLAVPEQPIESPKTFNRTNENIGWAAWSWNPVTGCEFGCEYCYAADIANRFYPEKFKPTFHEDRLSAPRNTNPRTDIPGGNRVFVCSMGELFGPWVPNEWIARVMAEVDANPQWTFLFLTKNPRRLTSVMFPDNAWVGTTVDTQARVAAAEDAMDRVSASVRFVSCEPLLDPVVFSRPEIFDWFIVGAKSEGGNKAQPMREWTTGIMRQAIKADKHLWLKDNLTPFLIQEAPGQ